MNNVNLISASISSSSPICPAYEGTGVPNDGCATFGASVITAINLDKMAWLQMRAYSGEVR